MEIRGLQIDKILMASETKLYRTAIGIAKTRETVAYLRDNFSSFESSIQSLFAGSRLEKLQSCSEKIWLFVRSQDNWRLAAQNRCRIHWLCPVCAHIRSIKLANRVLGKVETLMQNNPRLRCYFGVLTAPNQEELKNSFANIARNFRKLLARRRNAKVCANGSRANKYALRSALAKVNGGFYSFEVKRGENSNLWHPHINLLLLTQVPLDFARFQAEWQKLSGGSNIHIELLQAGALKKTIFEIAKYCLKFQGLAVEDSINAYAELRKSRLVGSFGCLRGVHEPDKENLEEDEIVFDRIFTFDGRFYQ